MAYDERRREQDGLVQSLDSVQTSADPNRYFVSGPMSRRLDPSSGGGGQTAAFRYRDFLPMPQSIRNLIRNHQVIRSPTH